MAKTKQILKIEHGVYSFHVVLHIYGDGLNPYWVYQDSWNCKTLSKSSKLVAKYADLTSVMYYLYQRTVH